MRAGVGRVAWRSPGRGCRCTASASMLVARDRMPGAGSRGPGPPECSEVAAGRTSVQVMMEALNAATADLDPPFAVVDLDAFDANAADLLRRAGGKRVRLASKSVRCRALIDRALQGGFTGILAFTLPEALWLDRDDVVVAYPAVDRAALAAVTERVTLMVDCREHLDLIAAGRVCLDVDAGWWPLRGALRIGAKRSPLRTPEQAAALAREVVARGLRLDGLMMYEAQIAGVGDAPPNRLVGLAVRAMQRASARELAARRAAVVETVRTVAPLRFVNGGGSGSVRPKAAGGGPGAAGVVRVGGGPPPAAGRGEGAGRRQAGAGARGGRPPPPARGARP